MDSSLTPACLDNPITRKLLKAQLERVKLQVEATTNGEEAIAAWEKYGPGNFQAVMPDHRISDAPPTYLYLSKAHSTSQICPCATVSKLPGGYERSKRNEDTIPFYQVSLLLLKFS